MVKLTSSLDCQVNDIVDIVNKDSKYSVNTVQIQCKYG